MILARPCAAADGETTPPGDAPAPVHRLTYASRAARPLSAEDLSAVALSAQRNNVRLGVGGLLIFCAGEFLQVLEGARATIEALYLAIERDPRHRDVTLIASESAPDRLFPDWSMGCFLAQPEDLPEGFFFAPRADHRLRLDALARAEDMLRAFYREARGAGLAHRFQPLRPA